MVDEKNSGSQNKSEPRCGIFALLVECFVRNIQLVSYNNEFGTKARDTKEAVISLLSDRFITSASFQDFFRTPDFREPLAQVLCLIHNEKQQKSKRQQYVAWPS